MAFWGRHETKQDEQFARQIKILRCSKLVKELNGQAITYDHVMQAVNCMRESGKVPMLKKVAGAKRFESIDLHGLFATSIPCQDKPLCLPAAGVRFPAVDVRAFEKEIPSFSSDQLQHLLDVCSAFYDLSTYKCAGPSGRAMVKHITKRVTASKAIQIVLRSAM